MSDHFQAFPRRLHQQVLSSVMGRLQAGAQVILAAEEFTALSQLAGNLNHYAGQAGLTLVECDMYESPPHIQRDVPLYVDVGYVYAIPIRCPYAEMVYEWSLSEFGSEPLRHRAKLSLVKGDLAGTEGDGNTVPILRFPVSHAGPFHPGSIVYANVALAVGVDRGHQTHYSCIQR